MRLASVQCSVRPLESFPAQAALVLNYSLAVAEHSHIHTIIREACSGQRSRLSRERRKMSKTLISRVGVFHSRRPESPRWVLLRNICRQQRMTIINSFPLLIILMSLSKKIHRFSEGGHCSCRGSLFDSEDQVVLENILMAFVNYSAVGRLQFKPSKCFYCLISSFSVWFVCVRRHIVQDKGPSIPVSPDHLLSCKSLPEEPSYQPAPGTLTCAHLKTKYSIQNKNYTFYAWSFPSCANLCKTGSSP